MLFGELTGELVAFGLDSSDPDGFLAAVERFAILNSVIGLVMLAVTYVSIWTYSYVANRQVRNFWLCDIVIMFSSLQQRKRAYLNITYAEVSTLGFFTE